MYGFNREFLKFVKDLETNANFRNVNLKYKNLFAAAYSKNLVYILFVYYKNLNKRS